MSGFPTKRTCKKCRTEKPIDEFTRNKNCKYGFEHRCKACAVSNAQSWAEGNRSKSRETKRRWSRNNPEKQKASEAASVARNRKKISARNLLYEKDNPEKKRAHRCVSYALKTGKLVKPPVCQACKKQRRIVAHHEDYSKPLVVTWVCHQCHNRIHSRYS